MLRICLLALGLAACSSPPSAPAPSGPGSAPALDLDAIARDIHDGANRARRSEGRAGLAWSDRLARVAETHSWDMARRGYFAHVSPGGEGPNDRAERLGVSCRVELGRGRMRLGVLENLYKTWRSSGWTDTRRGDVVRRVYDWQTPDQIRRAVVDGWLASPGHRRALLDASAREAGIAVAAAGDGALYVTQVLC